MRRRFQIAEGWFILVLLTAMVVSPGVAMRWAAWVPGLWVLQIIPLVAVLAGLLLAKSQFSAGLALSMSLIYGLFTVGLLCGVLLPAEVPWNERIPQMVARQAEWFQKAANVILNPDAADTSRDGMIFIMQTGFVLWVIGHTAAWYTFRRLRIWRAILPTAVLLVVTVTNYYGPHPMGVVLVMFIFLMLVYIVASHYLLREQGWQRAGVMFNRGTRWDFVQAGFLVALLVTPVAWLVPNVSAGIALHEVTRPLDTTWQRVQDGWTQLFASLKSYGGEYADPFGNTLALGGPRQIEPIPIMDVEANAGRYWRGIVYGTYTGSGWVNSENTQRVVLPDEPLEVLRYAQRQPITATITTYLSNSGLIYYPHQGERTDRQAKFTVIDLDKGRREVLGALSRYVLYEGQTYQSWGSVSVARDVALRRAGTSYPDWVRERYLQLPAEVSPRVIELAGAVAGPYETPYDQAEALTQWLRTNLTYNEAVEAPPIDVDPLEYLLFVSKEGYCNYYASALTVMLRTLGIPARMAAGYARGNWQDELGVYRVYSTNAHTWVEVFFPGYGWVEFEPTSAEPAIVRTASDGSAMGYGEIDPRDRNLPEEGPDIFDEGGTDSGEGLNPESDLGEETPFPALGLIAGGAVLLAAVVTAVVLLAAERRRTGGLSVVALVYDRMNSLAHWIGVRLLPTQTPYERATVLATSAPEGSAAIDVIADLYVEERFGQVREGTFDERAVVAWHELRPALLRRSLLHALSPLQRTDASGRRHPRR